MLRNCFFLLLSHILTSNRYTTGIKPTCADLSISHVTCAFSHEVPACIVSLKGFHLQLWVALFKWLSTCSVFIVLCTSYFLEKFTFCHNSWTTAVTVSARENLVFWGFCCVFRLCNAKIGVDLIFRFLFDLYCSAYSDNQIYQPERKRKWLHHRSLLITLIDIEKGSD